MLYFFNKSLQFMQNKGLCTLLLLLFLGVSVANAQQKSVSGKVINSDNTPLSNVSVVIKGTKTATTTDNNGGYSINVASNQSLSFSLVGYDTKEVRVGNSTTINVKLSAVDNTLEDVVVTAMDIRRNKKS